jgi:hypothetical protein
MFTIEMFFIVSPFKISQPQNREKNILIVSDFFKLKGMFGRASLRIFSEEKIL